MARIDWHKPLDRVYSAGISRGVIYGQDKSMYAAWHGLQNIEYATQGGDYQSHYVDGYKYHHSVNYNEYGARITAFTYPDEFESFIGGEDDNNGLVFKNQHHRQFHMTYRTERKTSLAQVDVGYEIHLVYNALVLPPTGGHSTYTEVVRPDEMSWDIRTKPIRVSGRAPTAEIVIKSWEVTDDSLKKLENILYGTTDQPPRMIGFSEVVDLFNAWPTAEILPNTRTGLAKLKYMGYPDLQGDNTRGLYTAPRDSRLAPTSISGFYKLRR